MVTTEGFCLLKDNTYSESVSVVLLSDDSMFSWRVLTTNESIRSVSKVNVTVEVFLSNTDETSLIGLFRLARDFSSKHLKSRPARVPCDGELNKSVLESLREQYSTIASLDSENSCVVASTQPKEKLKVFLSGTTNRLFKAGMLDVMRVPKSTTLKVCFWINFSVTPEAPAAGTSMSTIKSKLGRSIGSCWNKLEVGKVSSGFA